MPSSRFYVGLYTPDKRSFTRDTFSVLFDIWLDICVYLKHFQSTANISRLATFEIMHMQPANENSFVEYEVVFFARVNRAFKKVMEKIKGLLLL